jgi:hypothetical protein
MPIPSKRPRWENEGKPKRHTSSFDELASVHGQTLTSYRLLVLYRVRFFLNKIVKGVMQAYKFHNPSQLGSVPRIDAF